MSADLARWVRSHPLDVIVYVTLVFVATAYVFQEVYLCEL